MSFTACLTNLKKYREGVILSAPLSFPTTPEHVRAVLKEIRVDGLRNQEVMITDYTTDIPGLASAFGEYESVDELNYLASRLQGMDGEQIMKFSSAVEHGEYSGNLQDLINLTYNLDCFELLTEVMSVEEYGRFLVEGQFEFQLDEKASLYFDYAAYGEDTAINEAGTFTKNGYIYNNQSRFRKVYDGKSIPKEYRVFQYPLQPPAHKPKENPQCKEGAIL